MLTKLAWRNIWRNPRQSIVLILAISVGVICSLSLVSFYYGMIQQRIESVIQSEISHIQIHHPEFRNDFDPQYFIPNSQQVLELLQKNKNIKEATGRINVQGMVQSSAGSSGLIIHAVNPLQEQKVTNIASKISSGKFLDDQARLSIYLSDRLMSKLKVKLNSKLVFTFQNASGEVTSSAFKINGSFQTASSPFDLMNAYIRIEDMQNLQGGLTDFNEISVLLNQPNEIEIIQQNLKSQLKDLEILTWKEVSPEMQLLVSSFDQSIYIYMGIILLALAFGITNTMLMSVIQRTREFGMLLAFGMKKTKIFIMIMSETLFIAMCGLPIGLLTSLGLIKYFGNKGVNLSIYKSTMESFGYDQIIYPMLTINHIITLMILLFILVFISALGPARKALSLNPMESLRKI